MSPITAPRVVGPVAALVGAVGLGALVFGALAWHVPGPDVFGDELFYMDAGTALAAGDGLQVRESAYSFGPGYPALVAAVLLLVDNRSLAYQLILVVNAVVVATSIVPIYLLARRLVAPWPAVLVAASGLLLPVSFYAAYVMTECLGYVVALWALLAIQRAVERPGIGRQGVVLVACIAATAVRYQYAVLLPTFLVALWLRAVIEGSVRPGLGACVRRLWPTLAALTAGAALVAVKLVGDGSATSLLGGYSVLWRSYSPFGVVEWAAYHSFGIALYVLFLPFVLLPGIVGVLAVEARAGGRAASAFLGVWAAASLSGLVLVGAFSSTTFGEGRLHDRYLVYVVPLWIVALGAWLVRGAPVRRGPTLAVCAGLVALAVLTPLDSVIVFSGSALFDGAGTVPWAVARELTDATGIWVYCIVLAGIAAATALGLRSSRARLVGLVVVGLVMALSSWGMWSRAISAGGKGVFRSTDADERLWIDRAVGSTPVVGLFASRGSCNPGQAESAFLVSELFNGSVGRMLSLGEPFGYNLPETEVVMGAGGQIRDRSGRVERARDVVASPSLELDGRRIRVGTTSRLVLWRVDGPIRILRVAACARSTTPYPPPA